MAAVQVKREAHSIAVRKNLEKPLGRIKHLIIKARYRAEKKKVPFNLTVEDLLPIPSKCPILGISFNFQRGLGRLDAAPSLDRIDPPKGYVPGNVRIISWRANHLKSNMTVEEARAIVLDLEALK